MVREDIMTLPENSALVKLVDESCAVGEAMEDRDSWREAVSLKLESTVFGTQDRRQISEWLADVRSEGASNDQIDELPP